MNSICPPDRVEGSAVRRVVRPSAVERVFIPNEIWVPRSSPVLARAGPVTFA